MFDECAGVLHSNEQEICVTVVDMGYVWCGFKGACHALTLKNNFLDVGVRDWANFVA